MFRINNFIKKLAVKEWRLYDFKSEWRGVILITLCSKIVTMLISLLCGFLYLKSIFVSLINMPVLSGLLSGVVLALIELLNAYLLSKFFKFALRGKFKTALPVLAFALGVYAISFICSCNGIALYTSKNADLTPEITAHYNTNKDIINNEFKEVKERFEQAIKDIKNNPQIWSNGKPTLLSKEQSEKISSYYIEIKQAKENQSKQLEQLKEAYNKELYENQTNTTNEASKYYYICAIIMLIQVVTNGVLMFYYSKITEQDEPTIEQTEKIKAIDEHLINSLQAREQNIFLNYLASLNTSFALASLPDEVANPIISTNQTKPIQEENQPKEPTKKINITGFGVSSQTPTNEEQTPNPPNPPQEGTAAVPKVCPYCNKTFTPKNTLQKFCSVEHRVLNYNANHPENKIRVTPQKLR